MKTLKDLLQAIFVVPLSLIVFILYATLLWVAVIVGGIGLTVVSLVFYFWGIIEWIIGTDNVGRP